MNDISLGDRITLTLMSALDETRTIPKLAWLCAEHKMPANEIIPFLIDLAKIIEHSEENKCVKD